MKITKKAVKEATDRLRAHARAFPSCAGDIGCLVGYIKQADLIIDELHLKIHAVSQGSMFAAESAEVLDRRKPRLPDEMPATAHVGRKERFLAAWFANDTKTVNSMSAVIGQDVCTQWVVEAEQAGEQAKEVAEAVFRTDAPVT